jgi:hypothetical protein
MIKPASGKKTIQPTSNKKLGEITRINGRGESPDVA